MKNLILTALAYLALAATATAQSIPSYVPTAGLVGWWPFNGNANDESGNGRNGMVTGATLSTDRIGSNASCYEFNGSTQPGTNNTVVLVDNVIDVPNFTEQFSNAITISLWANIYTTNNGGFLQRRTSNNIDFAVGATLGSTISPGLHFGNVGNFNASTTTTSTNNTWHHYVYLYDGVFIKIYLDGIMVGQQLGQGPISNNTSTMNFGKYIYYGGLTHNFFYNGKLDDIGIWNRALTQAEITALYNSQSCTASISASGSTTLCQGGSVILSANPGAGLTYQWRNNGNNISGATDINYTTNAAGSYSVVVTDGNGCSAISSATTVTINPNPPASINASGSTTFCQGSSVVLSANSGANLTYQWLSNNSNIAGATAANYTANAAGSYSVAVTDGNGCSAISTATTVTINPNPPASLNASGSTTFCQGGSVALNANSGTNLTYQWRINGNYLSDATAANYTANVAGSYNVAVTDGNGCSSISTATTVIVNPTPFVSISGLDYTTNINANPVTLVGKPTGGSFSGPGVNGSVFNPRAAGLGNATVVYSFTDTNGCSSTASQTTVVSDSPPQLMSYQAVIRNGSNQLLINAPVGMRVSILQGSANGASVYAEKHSVTTNNQGLATLSIGGGTAQIGTFANINWANGPYFLKVETDPTGGSNYSITATSQLLSVPYALHASTATKAENGVPKGATHGQVFTFCDGVPVWTDGGLCPSKVSGFSCGSATNIGTLYKGIAAIGVSSTVSYTGGNGGIYSAQSVPSTGVTGLTATLPAGTLANGGGTLTYTISGTPSGSGTASFVLSLGGQTCTLTRNVDTLSTGTYPAGTVHCNGTPTAVVPVINPATGKIWMDRNLGASQVATSSTDAAAYGDLYEWGRRADGHQCRNSGNTSTLSSNDQPSHSNFTILDTYPYDWRSPQNDNLWQGVSGINNPCPIGYRIPTMPELDGERINWNTNNSAGAYASLLKFPAAGYRWIRDGSLMVLGTVGHYWTSTISANFSGYLSFDNSTGSGGVQGRAYGMSVRCIKD